MMTGTATAMKITIINIKTKTIKTVKESYRILKRADVIDHYARWHDVSVFMHL